MDFFSANIPPTNIDPLEESHDSFAQAIQRRFNDPQSALLTSRLMPSIQSLPQRPATPSHSVPLQHLTLASPRPEIRRPTAGPEGPPELEKTQSLSPSSIASVAPSFLPSLLSRATTLLVDIRPPSQYDAMRISPSVSLSVPSTLLRRPHFSLAKLSTMLPSLGAVAQFSSWPAADSVIVMDTDSSILSEQSNLFGLMRKFKAEDYHGQLFWVKGGFSAVTQEAQSNIILSELVVTGPPPSGSDDLPDQSILRARDLPHAAFEQASTTVANHEPHPVPSSSYPLGDIRMSDSQAGKGEQGSLSARTLAANPFYDNIRQFTELSHGITERIPLELSSHAIARIDQLPARWLRDIARHDNADILAMQFYKVEIAEQRRLIGIIGQHSRETQGSQEAASFPFSITAGVEKGSKNRYRNVWPFEHSRVHLEVPEADGCDYINASFVQPPGTEKRYIATQGPLPDTYEDFWSMIWQQDASVIVMLTRQFEGAAVKCGTYWPRPSKEEKYGDYLVKAVSISSDIVEPDNTYQDDSAVGFDFGSPGIRQGRQEYGTIKRVFFLSNVQQPSEEPREITQFQYLDWPDVNVPESPEGVLQLISQVEFAQEGARDGPVVLHCSAGVGRTGGYILVDAVLDAVKHELEKISRRPSPDSVEDSSATGADAETSSAEETVSQSRLPMRSEKSSATPNSLLPPLPPTTVASGSTPLISDSSSAGFRSANPTAGRRPQVVRKRVSSRLRGSSMDVDSTPLSLSVEHNQVLPSTARALSRPIGAHSSHSSLRKRFSPSASTESGSSLAPHASTYSTPASSILPSRTASPSQKNPSSFDFTYPRSGRAAAAPLVLLSSLDEPVQRVLEAMREQRMSLVNTLRQYVFANHAILEGSLAIWDALQRDSDSELGTSEELSSKAPGARVFKRGSIKRRYRSGSSSPQAQVFSRARQSTAHSSATRAS